MAATLLKLLAVTGTGQVTANDSTDGEAQSQNGSVLLFQRLLFDVAAKIVNQRDDDVAGF